MSKVRANEFYDRTGGASPSFPKGARVTGVITATSFDGDGSAITGLAVTGYIDSVNLTVSGITTTNGLLDANAEVNAAGGVDVTGGLKVGAASTLAAVSASGVINLTNTTDSTSSTTGAVIISGGVGIAKSLFVGNNVTIGGTLTYEDVTNIDSVGLITAQAGLNVSGGPITVGSGITVAQTGIVTFADGTASTNGVHFGSSGDLKVYHDGSNSYINDSGTGSLINLSNAFKVKNAANDEAMIYANENGGVELYFDNTKRVESTNTGAVVTGILTATTAAVIGAGITANNTNIHFNKALIEKTSIAGGTLGSNNNHSLADGMVYYCTGNESGNLTYNIRQDGSTALSAVMGVGETITTTVILTPNNSGKINTVQIDGNAQTVEEQGGDAFSAGSDGYDVYTFTILRTGTGNTDYLVLGTKSNHT